MKIVSHIAKTALLVTCPVGLCVLAHWKWGNFVFDAGAFAVGTVLSIILLRLLRSSSPNRWIAQYLNDKAVRILQSERLAKREAVGPRAIGPRPPKLDRATRLLQKAAFADVTWPVPQFNLACCFFYLNLVDSGSLNMEMAISTATKTPEDAESQHIINHGTEFAARVREAGDAWFTSFETVAPDLFLMSSHNRERSPASGGLRADPFEVTRRLAAKAATEAADAAWRAGYEEHFVKPHMKPEEPLSEEMRRCSDISKDLNLALYHISRHRLEDGERLLRKIAIDAEKVQHAQTRCIAFRTLGDFLYQMRYDMQVAESWLYRAAKEAERMATQPDRDDRRLRREVFKSLAEVLKLQGRHEEARTWQDRAKCS